MYCSNDKIKITDIEYIKNIKFDISKQKRSSLGEWYIRVRNKYLNELTDGDVARFIRQELYLEYIIPVAIEKIIIHPLAGEYRNGEILGAMCRVDISFWRSNLELKRKAIDSLNSIINNRFFLNNMEWDYESEANDFFNEVKLFLNNLKSL